MQRSKLVFSVVLTGIALLVTVLMVACGGGGGGGYEPPPPPDLSGVWAGSWEGVDSIYGQVSGDWEGEVVQGDAGVTGSFFLSGDVDCAEGTLSGAVDANNIPTGTLLRPPCPGNEWILTFLDLPERSSSGVWTKPATGGSGSFTGKLLATPGGPRIKFFYPPGGGPGTLITLVGTGFAPNAADNQIILDYFVQPVPELRAPDVLTVVRSAAQSSGEFKLQTADGVALSAHDFIADVTAPQRELSDTIVIGRTQEGIAYSPDSRRGYVASNHAGIPEYVVSMFDTRTNQVLVETALSSVNPVQGVAVSPDGRRLYVANAAEGIKVLHGVTLAYLNALSLPAGDGSQLNPQGVAISPDGKLLCVSQRNDTGAVTLYSLTSNRTLDTVRLGAGFVPGGVAFHPGGHLLYLTFASQTGNGQLLVYDLDTLAVVNQVNVGEEPLGLTVLPDGSKLYVGNATGNSVSVVDTQTETVLATIPVATPAGLSSTPDSKEVWVASNGSDQLNIIDTYWDVVTASLAVNSGPAAVAFSPDGRKAYISHASFGYVSEIGGFLTLSVIRSGTGLGSVMSTPAGIDCGSDCQENYPSGTIVTLTALAATGSTFSGWTGDADCQDGVVSMTTSKQCIANFTSNAGAAGEGVGGSGCFIATAAYGSYLDPHVEVLKRFRDDVLLTNRWGRSLVDFYYEHSPPLAAYIARHELLRLVVRVALTPLVYGLEYPLAALTLLLSGPAAWWWRRRRLRNTS